MIDVWLIRRGILVATLWCAALFAGGPAFAQDAPSPEAAVIADDAPAPLTADELEVLVARIALYPDELVALIASASLYPLEIVEAARFLDKKTTNASLEPKDDWDGSVVSLLNYPQIVTMMADDLDWTQELGDALAYQQKDVLIAIQQLREQAVANGVIKSDDKVTVVNEGDNVVIQSASPEVIYVPQYEPQMLYVPSYPVAPIAYYPTAYPSYYNPAATYFAGAVTGAIFASAVDWNDWGVWGGNYHGDVDIDCNNCFNNRNFNGKVNVNDVDWKNVDRSKVNINKNEFTKFERNDVKANLKQNNSNSLKNKSTTVRNDRTTNAAVNSKRVDDVRVNKVDANRTAATRNNAAAGKSTGARNTPARTTANDAARTKQGGERASPGNDGDRKAPGANTSRPAGKPKPAAKPDNRSKQPSPLGEVNRGKTTKVQSDRGKQARSSSPKPKKPARSGNGGNRKR